MQIEQIYVSPPSVFERKKIYRLISVTCDCHKDCKDTYYELIVFCGGSIQEEVFYHSNLQQALEMLITFEKMQT